MLPRFALVASTLAVMMRQPLAWLLVAPSSMGCVSRVHYEQCVSAAAQAKAQADAKQKEDATRIQGLQSDLGDAQTALQDRDAKISDLSTANHNTQTQLDEATAINQQLRAALQRLGRDVDKMLSERGTLSKALDDAKARLEELRRAQAAAEVRIALFRSLASRFKPLVDAGQMRVQTRRGQPVLEVSGDLLFDAGHSELRAAGKGALMEIAHALQSTASASDRRFLVTAFIDADAKGRGVKSSWELTGARAASVVEYLVSLGTPAPSLVAASGGAFDPIASNELPQDRARNRRVEIALLPLESELVPASQ